MIEEFSRESESQGAVSEAEAKAKRPQAGGVVAASRSFKLRFAAEREPGRSNLSAIRPLALPVPVTDKFYTRPRVRGGDRGGRGGRGGSAGGVEDEEAAATERALRRVRESFSKGPRDTYPHPVTTAHEYGWWSGTKREEAGAAASSEGARTRHHIRDSAWLRERLRLLAPDKAFKRR